MIYLLVILFSLDASSGIFGEDDRISPREATTQNYLLSQSVPALILNSSVTENNSGDFTLKGSSFRDANFCADEKFIDESGIAICSASLIAPNRVLTAGHCFSEIYTCENYKIVFDYVDGNKIISKDNVYSCKKIIFRKYDGSFSSDDIAIFELDRDVINRNPIRLELDNLMQKDDKLSMIGYPYGMSQKVVEVGQVTAVPTNIPSFFHNLDSFAVNSGSPIFNQEGIQIGVHTAGSGINTKMDRVNNCRRWGIEKSGYSIGNLLEVLKTLIN